MARPRLYEEGSTSPNDRLYCDICDTEYTRAHKSQHHKSEKHKNNVKEKLKTSSDKPSKAPAPEKKVKKNIVGTIDDVNIEVIEDNDEYYFKYGDEVAKGFETESVIDMMPQNINPRAVVYVCGKSNSGKSTFCRQYVDKYMDMYPDRDIYIVLKDEFDKERAFKGLKYKNVYYPDLEVFMTPVKMDEFPDGSLILLDDIDYIGVKEAKENLYKLRDEIMGAGSKRKISLVLTSHLINKGQSTREIINEMNQVVLFPNGCINMDYFLEHYLGFSKKDIENVHKLKTRYVLINNGVPQYLLSRHKIYML